MPQSKSTPHTTNVQQLLNVLGTFWEVFYKDRQDTRAFLDSRLWANYQSWRDIHDDVSRWLIRAKTPCAHVENWFLVPVRRSQLRQRLPRYGDPIRYGDIGLEYGRPASGAPWEIPLPTLFDMPVQRAAALVDVPAPNPALVWQHGVDFVIDSGLDRPSVLWTYRNPFDAVQNIENIYDEAGRVIDQTVQLWLVEAEFDPLAVYKNWGVLLNYDHASSSERYRDAVNALLDGCVAGGTEDALLRFLQAITGISLARDNELIEHIYVRNTQIVVVTDKNAYSYPSTAQLLRSVGDRLHKYDPITDGLLVYDLRDPQALPLLSGIYAGPGFVHGTTGVFFPNRTVPILVEKDRQGRTHVRWEIGGNPDAVEQFWQDVRRRGIEQGRTLARYLDRRGPNAPTEPDAHHLPATINPAQFVAENLLRANTAVAVLGIRAENTPTSLLRLDLLRHILPPWTALLVVHQERSQDTIEANELSEDAGTIAKGRIALDVLAPGPSVQDGAQLMPGADPPCEIKT